MKRRRTRIATNQITTFSTSIAAIMIMSFSWNMFKFANNWWISALFSNFTRSFVVWMDFSFASIFGITSAGWCKKSVNFIHETSASIFGTRHSNDLSVESSLNFTTLADLSIFLNILSFFVKLKLFTKQNHSYQSLKAFFSQTSTEKASFVANQFPYVKAKIIHSSIFALNNFHLLNINSNT